MAFKDSKPSFEVSKQQKLKVLNELHHPGLPQLQLEKTLYWDK